MNKNEIIDVLNEIADILELLNENPFRVRAYRNAARTLENLSESLENLIQEEKLEKLPGIGKDLSEKITTLFTKGKLPFFQELKKKIPKGLSELLEIEGLGPKKIASLYKKGIKSSKELKKACEEGKIAKISGFGEKTQKNILSSQENIKRYSSRFLYFKALQIALPILEELKKQKSVEIADIAGSLRRKKETVGDIDFVAAANNPKEVMKWFTSLKTVTKVLVKGDTKSSIKTTERIQIDLRIVKKEEYGYVLHHSTGSKEHNIHLRGLAKEKGLKISEWGIVDKNKKSPITKKNPTEQDLYASLGLKYIPPELRENTGEIEAARKNKLPTLIEEKDILGVFHAHTTESDGKNSLEEMAKAAEKMGFQYLGISDHSKSSTQANGLDEKRLEKQISEIKKLNRSKTFKTHLFSGIECDILGDGTLDFPDNILKMLDFVIVSIHRGFKGDEKTMTKRLIKAIENPHTTMVGHLTGRLLLKREPYHLNIPKVIDAAIANKKIIEINGQPQRLDMDWRHWHAASKKGLITSINPDAHSTDGLKFFSLGVNIARKGWLEKKHILNSWPLEKIISYLKKSK